MVKTLNDAIKSNNFNLVKKFIENGADVNNEDKGFSPLRLAVSKNKINIVRFLLQNGANVNKIDSGYIKDSIINNYMFVPLGIAIDKNVNLDIIRLLLQAGADIHYEPNQNYKTGYIFFAVHNRNIDVIPLLIEAGLDIHTKDPDGDTPLFWSARRQFDENTSKVLLELGARINDKDNEGNTPLHHITKVIEETQYIPQKHLQFFVENGANVNARNNKNETPIFSLWDSITLPALKYLVKNGADITAVNNDRQSLIHKSCSRFLFPIETVKYLVEQNPNLINMVSNWGNTPLHLACYRNSENIIKFLIEKGANVNVRNNDGQTPRDILKNGANKNTLSQFDKVLARLRWHRSLPKVKKAVRNRVFLNEVVGWPSNVSEQVAELSARFGRSRRRNALNQVNLDILFLIK